MGILSFIKKIFSEPEEIEKTRIKVSFSDIGEFIKKKSEETNVKENQAISLINKKIKTFTKELKENIKIVNEVDIEQKDKNDKIKSSVYEGRKKYIEFLEKFMDNIEGIENIKGIDKSSKTNLERIIENINSAFLRFNESSEKSYERATILIGKEMGNIKETLKKFSNELITIFNENKEIISTSKKLSLIESKVNETQEINEKSKESDEEISNFSNKILDKEKESREISENIDKIKKSSEYLENIEKEKSIGIQGEKVEEDISELRQFIDFKALSNFFHIFEDRMAIVKLYKDDFLAEFKKDRGNRLLNLLNESKLNNEKIYDKIKQIQDEEQEIELGKREIKEDKTKNIYIEIERIKEEIKNLTNEKEWAEKKKEKLKTNKEENFNTIKKELESMNLDLEY